MSYELLRRFATNSNSSFSTATVWGIGIAIVGIMVGIIVSDSWYSGLSKKKKITFVSAYAALFVAGLTLVTIGIHQENSAPKVQFPYDQIKADMQEDYYVNDLYTAQDPSIPLSSDDAKSEQRDIAKAVDGAVVEVKVRYKDVLVPVGFTYDSETKRPKLVELAEKPTSQGISQIEKLHSHD